MNKAFSLVELLIVLIISCLLMVVGWPLFGNYIDETRFQAFSAELTGHLFLVRHLAQTTETSVQIDFDANKEYRYQCVQVDGPVRRVVSQAEPRGGYDDLIGTHLISGFGLAHPTQKKDITKALSSTHAPRFIFAPKGSSSGTLVFTDGRQRAVCVVVSGSTGRFSIFRQQKGEPEWRNIF
ncbi:MAG: prepilin-type N-terminal cleavage/methylation domain-containing protein [Acidobacteriota bacterium]|nr:prepilin-type N-terminal cleavage/methylation domain-containing protein [Acidobacteriota bacterium]